MKAEVVELLSLKFYHYERKRYNCLTLPISLYCSPRVNVKRVELLSEVLMSFKEKIRYDKCEEFCKQFKLKQITFY